MKKSLVLIITLVIILSKTHPVQAQSFSFGAAGDYANGSNFQATVKAIKAANANFNLSVGDLAYTTAEASWCGYWTTNFPNNVIVSGNHDSGESSSGNINTYIQNCPFTLGVPVTGSYGKQFYFDYPAVNPIARIIMISPGLKGSYLGIDTNYSAGSQGYTFTANAVDDARAKGLKWVFVGMHKNYISMMEKGNELGTDLIKMLIDKRVDVILQGHEHGYERTKQLTCAKTGTYDATCVANSTNSFVKGAGTIIDVVGTGGQTPRSINTSDSEATYFASYDVTTNGFGFFTVTATNLTYKFIRSAGGTFTDSFTISATGSTPLPTPTPVPTLVPTPTPRPTVTPIPTSVPSPTPSCSVSLPASPSVTLTTQDLTPGSYRLWARMMSTGTSGNAFYAQIDSQCPILVGDASTMPTGTWTWVNYRDGSTTTPMQLTLAGGIHTVKIFPKELSTKIDKLLLLSDASCIPTGFGDNCSNAQTACPTDINGDRMTDISDYSILVSNFLKNPFTQAADINKDGAVDLSDYSQLVQKFLKACP